MPKSALPVHLQDIASNFPDDSQYGTNWIGKLYRWYNKKTKTWFAFSFRCTERWARWRKSPILLFAMRGRGRFRLEGENIEIVQWDQKGRDVWFNWEHPDCYFSRQQLYCRWHIALQWPLMFSFHFYPKAIDVPKWGEARKDLDGKVWYGYWGHFDADLVYWMATSMYLGRNFK